MLGSAYVAVIGSVNMDICGRPDAAFVPKDSNPGTVTTSPGGVGANIARNLRLLGYPVKLVTALGGDLYALHAREMLSREGVDLSAALEVPEGRTSTYLYITDAAGDMVAAVSDMKVQEALTSDQLRVRLPLLNAAAAVVLDANLSEQALRFAAENITAPLFADAVSAAKVRKLRPVLPKLRLLKLNRIEAEALTGVCADSLDGAERAGQALLHMGLRQVYITLGGDGALWMNDSGWKALPCAPAGRIVNTTGAGDAFTAATIWSWFRGDDPDTATRHALAAAAIALEGDQAVNPMLGAEEILRRCKAQNP